MAYDYLHASYLSFITATSYLTEPTTYAETCKDPRWLEAMKAEI